MAKHSLGGKRTWAILHAPDREIRRLSPVQEWLMRAALVDPNAWCEMPPTADMRAAAQALMRRGLVYLTRDGLKYRYRTLACAEIPANSYAGKLIGDLMRGHSGARGVRSGYRKDY